MAKKEKKQETPVEETEVVETPETPVVDPFEEKYNLEHDAHLRLAA